MVTIKTAAVIYLIYPYVVTCYSKINTFNFIYYELSSEQFAKYACLRDLPFREYSFKGLPSYLIVKSLAAKLNVSNVLTTNWFNQDVSETLMSQFKPHEGSNEATIVANVNTYSNSWLGILTQWERFTRSSQKPIFVCTQTMD